MDAPSTNDAPSAADADAAQLVRRQRAQVQEFVAQHRRRLDRIQTELADQVARLTGQLDDRQHDAQALHAQLDEQRRLQQEREEQLAALQAELDDGRAEWDAARAALDGQRGQLTEQLAQRQAELTTLQEQIDRGSFQVQQAQRALAAEREEQALEKEDLLRLRKRLEERRDELDRRQESLEDLDIRTKGQRRRIANELQEQRDQLRKQHSEAKSQRRWVEQADALNQDIAALEARNAELADQLRQAEEAAAQRVGNHVDADAAQHRETERRYDLAIEEIHQQRTKISSLEQELADARRQSTRRNAPAVDDNAMDWEAQKRRMLVALENMDGGEPGGAGNRVSINDLVRRTDVIVAERDREIAELRAHLEQQSANLGNVAVGAAAIAHMLDSDDIVRQERENLQQLQREWQEKLRQAEVDLSLERAKIARERVAIEEKLLTLEKAQAERGSGRSSGSTPADDKPVRGRWLARLGLKDDDVQ